MGRNVPAFGPPPAGKNDYGIEAMPIYEYECSDCGHQFEALILPKTRGTACPECKSKKLERLMSSFAVDSAGTRKANLAAGRKQYAPIRKEKEVEQRKYEEKVRRGDD
jgi:putative FmdB family regulatory protein